MRDTATYLQEMNSHFENPTPSSSWGELESFEDNSPRTTKKEDLTLNIEPERFDVQPLTRVRRSHLQFILRLKYKTLQLFKDRVKCSTTSEKNLLKVIKKEEEEIKEIEEFLKQPDVLRFDPI